MKSNSDRSVVTVVQARRRSVLLLATLVAAKSANAEHERDDTLVIVDGWVVKKSDVRPQAIGDA